MGTSSESLSSISIESAIVGTLEIPIDEREPMKDESSPLAR